MNKKSILIIDNDDVSQEVLRHMFENEYTILSAKDARDGITLIGRHIQDLAAIIMDLVLPGMNGYQFLQLLHSRKITEKVPIILVTSQKNTQIELACYSLGVTTIITKPFVAQTIHLQVTRTIEVAQKAESLANAVQNAQSELNEQSKRMDLYYDRLLEAISNMIEFRSQESGDHVKHIKGITRLLANAYMRLYPDKDLTAEKINLIVRSAALHDIGKIVIPEGILLKPGKLTDEERTIIMSHTTKGCEILNYLKDVEDPEQHQISYDICRYHHERYDGSGYPDGLSGNAIPLAAQFVSIADVYDALVSERSYKKAFDRDVAYNMILGGECGAFAPELLACMRASRDEIEDLYDAI